MRSPVGMTKERKMDSEAKTGQLVLKRTAEMPGGHDKRGF